MVLQSDQADETIAAEDAATGSAQGVDAPEVARGTVVGRYVVVATLGAGGMGIVYAAYDPELDRKVALKLLRRSPHASTASSAGGQTRLLGEARALAKVQHPNVVAIHDVGTHDDRVWIAMEFVQGETLRAWRKRADRGVFDVLDVLVRAGRGVAAAHAAGLLHRDLKPDNIMVADDGRVRVMDFGLAARHGGAHEPTAALAGTPAYMAPEQFAGGELSAASDQFGFCVTAWEALFGARPFAGESITELATAVVEGNLRSPPADAKVPRWVRGVLQRGLAVAPEERFASMDALLDALQRGRSQVRRNRVLFATSLGIVAIASILGWQAIDRQRRIAACAEEGASITAIWNDARADTIAHAFDASGLSYAADTWTRSRAHITAYAETWSRTRVGVCERAEVDHAMDPELAVASRACLDEQHDELEALLVQLQQPDATVVQLSGPATAGLTRVERCTDAMALRRRGELPADPTVRARVADLRRRFAEISAASATGRYEAARQGAEAALRDATALDWTPIIAEAREALASVQIKIGQYQDAHASLQDAFFEAGASQRDELGADIAIQLVYLLGDPLGMQEEALHWSRLAQMLLERASFPAEHRAAALSYRMGLVHHRRGEYPRAQEYFERALQQQEQVFGLDHPHTVQSLNGLANVHAAVGEYDKAIETLERACRVWGESFGADHPEIGRMLLNVARVHALRGDYERAEQVHTRGLTILQGAFGPEHPDVATALNNLAAMHYARGDFQRSLEVHTQALAIRRKVLGPEHPNVASSLENLGLAYHELGDEERALAAVEQAVAIRERVHQDEHPELASAFLNLGIMLEARGEHARALELFERALAIWEKVLGPKHQDVALALSNIAAVHEDRGEPADAIAYYDRALTILEAIDGPTVERGKVQFALANVLWEADTDRARAIDLATASADVFRSLGQAYATRTANVERWLREHGSSSGARTRPSR